MLFEQGDDRLALRLRDPRQAERLELGQELGRTGVVRDQRIAVAIDGGSSGEQLAERAGDGGSGHGASPSARVAKVAGVAGGSVLIC